MRVLEDTESEESNWLPLTQLISQYFLLINQSIDSHIYERKRICDASKKKHLDRKSHGVSLFFWIDWDERGFWWEPV